jgi:DNA-binding GntR family transcriptional regulator
MDEDHGKTDIARAIPDELARRLGDDIIFNRLLPETRLTEEQVAATYGVSRSPVREAVRLLERDGLVRRSARRGFWVAPVSLTDFDEIYTCRIALEAIAAGSAACSPEASQAQAHFADLLARLRTAEACGDARSFFDADVEGSELIYKLAANATLRRLLASLEKQALRYRFFAYAQSPEVIRLSVDGTAAIYDRICAGDAAQARSLTVELIEGIWQKMRPIIGQSFQAQLLQGTA